MKPTIDELYPNVWPGIYSRQRPSRNWVVVWENSNGERFTSAAFGSEQQAEMHKREIEEADARFANYRPKRDRYCPNKRSLTRLNLRVEPEIGRNK